MISLVKLTNVSLMQGWYWSIQRIDGKYMTPVGSPGPVDITALCPIELTSHPLTVKPLLHL